MIGMSQSLIREANGNVILSSGLMQLRFFQQFGATPLEFWRFGFPGPITNSFAGSGTSLNFEVGQDPTQATANSFTPNPVSRIDQAGEKFYLREVLFHPSGKYGIEGYIPDFWASIEPHDDYVPVSDSDTGWRTKYAPGAYAARLANMDCPVIFDGNSSAGSGIFAVGNEMAGPNLRIYKNGWLAFKVTIAADVNAAATSLAGLFFQKEAPFAPTKDNMYSAPGLRLIFNMQGGWALDSGGDPIVSGNLTASQVTKLHGVGLPVEVRTQPGVLGYLEIYIDNALAQVVYDTGITPVENTWFGLFAQASQGSISFFYRQIFDLNAKINAYYFALPNQRIRIHQVIQADNLPFYRANMPGMFLNKNVFTNPSMGVIHFDDTYEEKSGMIDISLYKSLWAGNPEGTLGLLATVKKVEIDGNPSLSAHANLDAHGSNDEFVMAFNPFSILCNETPQNAKKITMITEWATSRV